MTRLFAALAVLVLAVPAFADESWTTEFGDVIYETEIGDVAVWSYPSANGKGRGWLYFPGLAGNYDDRSVHEGYWIEEVQTGCSAELIAVDGRRSHYWGRVLLVFDRAAFPTGWTALGGDCFEEPWAPVRGDLPY